MVLPPDFDPQRTQLACSRILWLTSNSSTAMNNVYDIPKFWINLDGLRHSSNLNAMESCITRVYCMQGALNFHHWLVNIVQRVVESPSRHTWIEKLAWDVQIAIDGKQTTTFNSADYLPNLKFHREYTYIPSILPI